MANLSAFAVANRLVGNTKPNGMSYTHQSYFDKMNDLLNSPIGTITSRDQIINPYDYLDISNYKNTAKGQALYEEHLAALQQYQAQQQAAYDEWYNSEEQQALRQRDTGLNPDLIGVESSEAAETQIPLASPLEGIPTSAEQASSIAGIVSSVASVAALPFSIGAATAQMSLSAAQKGLVGAQAGLTAAQAAGQQIANVGAFEGHVYAAMAANLADAVGAATSAGKAFDFNSWIDNPESTAGIFESYAPSDNAQYRAAFDRAKKNIIKHKSGAYAQNAIAAHNQTQFAEALSNPYFDSNILVQIAGLEPTMSALEQIRVAKEKYFDKVRVVKEEYIAGLDPAKIAEANVDEYVANATKAEFEALTAEVNYIVENARKTIRMNYMDMYKREPTSVRGLTGAYFVLDKTDMKYRDFLFSNYLETLPEDSLDFTGPQFKVDQPPIVQQGDSLFWPKRPFTIGDIFRNR